jgi:uncharacterized protein YggE
MTMAEAPRLTVYAEGSKQFAPDRANVDFRVRVRGTVRARTVQRARTRLRQLATILDTHRIAPEDRRTQQITATELLAPKTGKPTGYEASAVVTVRLKDFSRLGALLAAAGSEGDVDVTGPQWEVSASNPGHLEVCRLATEMARLRADAYADGLGMRIGRLLTMQEADGWQQRGAQMTLAHNAADAAAVDEGGGFDLSSGVMRLSTTISATFEVVDVVSSPRQIRAATGRRATPQRQAPERAQAATRRAAGRRP